MTTRIESALAHIPADHRDTWLMAAMGIKAELGEDGFDLWDSWSQQAKSYSAQAARSVWKSCKGSGVSIGSVFHEAKQNGWVDNDKHARPTPCQIEARQHAAAERATAEGQAREQAQQQAARKAAWIMHQCQPEQHAYLQSKGWAEAKGAVWWAGDDDNLLCIPMRVGSALVGVQMIDREGGKRYLTGQRTSGAEYCIDNSGRGAQDWFVEGFATGLSLRECLQALRLRYRIHVAFSASNLVKVAALYCGGLVVADTDASGTGERVAVQTGLPYFLPDAGDFNDLHQRDGTFQTSQALRRWMQEAASMANA